jgi:hypothetical protein
MRPIPAEPQHAERATSGCAADCRNPPIWSGCAARLGFFPPYGEAATARPVGFGAVVVVRTRT